MRNILLAVGVAGLVGLFSACSGKDHAGALADGTSGGKASFAGRTSTAGKSAGGSSNSIGGAGGDEGGGENAGATAIGGAAGDGQQPSGGSGGSDPVAQAPIVTVLSPGTVKDPLGGAVLVGDSVDVVCKVTAAAASGASAVDPLTVKVAVLNAQGDVISEKDAGLTANADEYASTLPLTAVETGKATIRCSGSSVSKALGSDQHDTLVDRGPKISLIAPPANAKLALNDKLNVSFTVEPQPLGADDIQADVAGVTLKVNGVTINATPVANVPGTYAATVDFLDAAFATKPNGATTIAIAAPNKRSPVAAVASSSSSVLVDGAGPIITIKSPVDKTLVGGDVTLSFTVTDLVSGVNPDSVNIRLNTDKSGFDLTKGWTQTGDTFSYKFDSRMVTDAEVQISITINAEDNVKNPATPVNIATYLDNQKPQVDLDPQNIRTQSTPDGDCSGSFDPLGPFAVNDLQQNGTGYDFLRVFVWDTTNFINASKAQLHFAGTDPNSVRIYFQNPGDAPSLLINSKAPGTGMCDEIGDTSRLISMSGLAATGSPYYSGENLAPPTSNTCSFTSEKKPPQLCTNGASDMWQVAGHFEGDLSEPAVYVRSPTANKECTGIAWDYSSLAMPDANGFVCFAARAVDKVGNVGISPPLRLCVDTDPNDNIKPPCATASKTPPSCTDGCTPPARGGGFVTPLN